MHAESDRERGFTIVEMVIAAMLVAVATALGMYGWMNVVRGERRNSTQAELDISVRTAIERIRAETRLSAIDKMVYFPDGPGPYKAISFPAAFDRDEDGLTPTVDDGTKILWDSTVIYHVAAGEPDKLMRTVFTNRDNGMSDDERRTQLASVVANGNGEGAEGVGETASSRVIFANFFDWSIDPTAGDFDAYASRLGRSARAMGSARLSPGNHIFTFTCVGKNTSSSGYKLGLDTLCVSATGHHREAEDQTASASPTVERAYSLGWSGHNHALVPAINKNATLTLTMANDRWEETNFDYRQGQGTGHVAPRFDFARKDIVMEVTGSGVVWNASEQTYDADPPNAIASNVNYSAFRVLIRGGVDGAIRHDGRLLTYADTLPSPLPSPPNSYVRIRVPPGASLGTPSATITEAKDLTSLDGRSGAPVRRLQLYPDPADAGCVLGVLRQRDTDNNAVTYMNIDHTNSYVVTFWIYNATGLVTWDNNRYADVSSMTAVHTNCATATAFRDVRKTATWTGLPHVLYRNDICYVQEIVTVCAKEGYYVSQVFDTTMDVPRYDLIEWREIKPDGTDIEIQSRAGSSAEALAADEDWSAVPLDANGGSPGASYLRYVQFRARLVSDDAVGATPLLRSVTIGWPGEDRIVDVGGVITVGPDFGAYSLTVDGEKVIRGLHVALEIYKDVPGTGGAKRLTSSMSIEVEPRNSYK
ncbi:MAG: type II secretion system protein [Kiritimatiellae bacterium]|nr:type II secretion system protein [Kiritimatiellia bacterium]